MKEKDQKRLMYELFYGVDGEEDSISYLDMLLRGEGELEDLFEVVGNEGRKKLREIFSRRPEKFYLGRSTRYQKTITNLASSLCFLQVRFTVPHRERRRTSFFCVTNVQT